MKRPGRHVLHQSLCLLATVLLFAGLRPLQREIDRLREAEGVAPPTQDPAEIVPILVLGGFRGVAVDILWIRGEARREQKEYYELMAIYNLISKLQPDFPTVWIFQAWNMAYNIAHEWVAKEDKWDWIKAGLAFATKGADKNPRSADMLYYVGHLYWHRFNDSVFRENGDYFREQLRKEQGLDNYEVAFEWMTKSLAYESKVTGHEVHFRMTYHVLADAARRNLMQGDRHRAMDYTRRALRVCARYRNRHPDDDLSKDHQSVMEMHLLKMEIDDCTARARAAQKAGEASSAADFAKQCVAKCETFAKKYGDPVGALEKRVGEMRQVLGP